MNKRSVWTAGVFFLLTVMTATAQETKTVALVLPSGTNVVKLLVADNPSKLVSIRFYDDDGLIAKDEVLGKDAQGFIRRYDLNRVPQRNFRMQIVTANASFTYEILKDGNGVTAELRETTQTFPVLAAR